MPRIDSGIVAKGKEHGPDRPDQRRVVAARQIGATDASRKQRIAHEEISSTLTGPSHLQADSARAVSRCVMHTHLVLAKRHRLVWTVVTVDRGQVGVDLKTEAQALRHGILVEEHIVAMQMDGRTKRALGDANARDVVDVRMGEQDVRDGNALARDELQQSVHFVAGIDEQTLTRARARHNVAVLVERSDSLRLDYDHAVILAILDDLLFTSRIRGAATQAGVEVAIARSSASAFEQIRNRAPTLVILDLNNPRTDPLGIVRTMMASPDLAAIPTLGYVSHVDGDTIAAARAAGVGQVLARSAFVTRLAELLTGTAPGASA